MAIPFSLCLSFNDSCRDAMSFYKECIGGELFLQTVAEIPIAAQCPAGMQQHIILSSLTGNGFIPMATEISRHETGFKTGNETALCLNFGNEKGSNGCYEKPAARGKSIESLKNVPGRFICCSTG